MLRMYCASRILFLFFSIVFSTPLLAQFSTDSNDTSNVSQTSHQGDAVAVVLGKPVLLADITPDNDTLLNIRQVSPQNYKALLTQIMVTKLTNHIIEAVLIDYGQQQNIQVDSLLVEKFKQRFGPEYAKNNQKLEAQRQAVQQSGNADSLADKKEPASTIDDIALTQVRRWQIEKQLYAQYGGTVLFEQSNPQMPVEAYLALMKAYSNNGKFEILDKAYTRHFWKAFEPPYEFVIAAEDVDFSSPWWL